MSALAMILTTAIVVPGIGPVVIGSILFPVPNPHITLENAERIREAKSLREVEAILGGKAGDYRTGPTRSPFPGSVAEVFEGEPLTKLTWDGDNARIEVLVTSKGRVVSWGYNLMFPERIGIFRTMVWRCQHWRRANFWWFLPVNSIPHPKQGSWQGENKEKAGSSDWIGPAFLSSVRFIRRFTSCNSPSPPPYRPCLWRARESVLQSPLAALVALEPAGRVASVPH